MTVSFDLLRPVPGSATPPAQGPRTPPTPHAAAASSRPHRVGARSGPVLAGLAALVALWLGLTAPSVSPVTPVQQVSTIAPVQPVGTIVVVPVPQAPAAGPLRRRR